jgi:AAHS family benzoate transporter-like MFS transporter
MTIATPLPEKQRTKRSGLVIVGLCFAIMTLDGYDLMVYGAIAPALIDYQAWDLSAYQVGLIGSYTTFGMLVGALSVGALSDVLGRRRVLLISTLWFSLATAVTALAPSPEIFGLFRFLAGVGLGGVMPTAIAHTVEYAPPGRKQFYNAMMFVGYSAGGVLASVADLVLLSATGFRTLLWIGAAPALILLPLLYFRLPESVSYLTRRGRTDEAEQLIREYGLDQNDTTPTAATSRQKRSGALRYLMGRGRRGPLVLFSVASFAGLMLVYGLNNWLPEIMRTAGYPLDSSLGFLLVLNLGAVVGTVSVATLADKVGSKIAVSIAFLAAVVSLAALSSQPHVVVLYLAVAIAGLGSIGTQILVNGYAAEYFPGWTRGTAVGITLGVGRVGAVVAPVLVGAVLDSQLSFGWNFYVFVIAAALGLLMVVLIPTRRPMNDSNGDARTTPASEMAGSV